MSSSEVRGAREDQRRLEGRDDECKPPSSSSSTPAETTGVEAKKSKMESSSSSDHKEVKSRDSGRHRGSDSSRHHKSSHKSSNNDSSSRHKKESSSRRDRDRRRSRSRDKHSSSKRGHDSKKSSRRDSSSSSSSSSASSRSSSSSSSSSSRRRRHRDDRRDSDRRKHQSSRHRRSSSRDRHKHSRHDSHRRDSRDTVAAPRPEEKPQRDANAAANARSIADRLSAAIKADSPSESGATSSASLSTSDLLKSVQVPKAIISDPVEAAKYQMEQLRKKTEEITGVKVPSFYSSNAINPLVYAEQQRKRKLLWSKAKDNENTSTQIVGKAIVEGQDEKTAEKFRKLMGLKSSPADAAAATASHDSASNSPSSSSAAAVDQIHRMQKQAFDALDREYAFARMATHTHRGMGLGFATQGFSSSTQPAPKNEKAGAKDISDRLGAFVAQFVVADVALISVSAREPGHVHAQVDRVARRAPRAPLRPVQLAQLAHHLLVHVLAAREPTLRGDQREQSERGGLQAVLELLDAHRPRRAQPREHGDHLQQPEQRVGRRAKGHDDDDECQRAESEQLDADGRHESPDDELDDPSARKHDDEQPRIGRLLPGAELQDPQVPTHQKKGEALISSIDIIDMDTYNVFVVSFVLKRKILSEQFFVHLYSDFKTCNFEQLLECGQEYELDVLPHRVSHLRLIRRSDSSSERLVSHEDRQISTSFIMVNCSQRINVFYSIDAKNRRFDQVVKIEDFFVEFKHENFVDNCTSHDIKYLDSSGKSNEPARAKHRLTALGFQNGALAIFLVDADKNEILKSFKHENDSFISQVQFFTTKSYRDWSKIDADKTPINLLVLRSLEPTRVINDVLHAQSEQDEFQDLEISHFCDLVTSAVIYDATFSGYNSIVLGTFGKVACFFCPVLVDVEPTEEADAGGPGSGSGAAGDASKSSSTSSATRASGFFKPGTKTFRYELKRELLFKHSILGLYACKLSSNGAYDLAVLTLNGISIWQYDPDSLIELINQKYQQHEKTINEAIASKLSTNAGAVEL